MSTARDRGKRAEKMVAAKLGGERVSGARGVGIEDVSHDRFSIEVKTRTAFPALIRNAMQQCRTNAPAGKIPLVVLHETNKREYYCVLAIEDLTGLMQGASAPISLGTPNSSEIEEALKALAQAKLALERALLPKRNGRGQ